MIPEQSIAQFEPFTDRKGPEHLLPAHVAQNHRYIRLSQGVEVRDVTATYFAPPRETGGGLISIVLIVS